MFSKNCPGITSEGSTKAVQVLPMRIQQKLSGYNQRILHERTGGVSVEREFALCLEENEMKFALF